MKNTARALTGYGVFLIVAGLIGYLSNPEKAKTALRSGGTFGLLHIGLGLLAKRGMRRVVAIALAMATLLGGIFVWRTVVTWQAVAGGANEKTLAAVLITSMLVATIVLAAYLVRRRGER